MSHVVGRLTLSALKHPLIEYVAGFSMLLLALVAAAVLFYFHRWKWLWREWLTSLDPKKIGVMYLIVVLVMFFKGLIDAAMMRAQQALAVGDSYGYLSAEHFQQIFSAHGTTMIFFVAMGIIFGTMNLVVPLQIGARDVALPFLNSLAFWLFASAALLLNLSLVVGKFSACGWLAYPPLSGIEYSPGVGVDYWIWILQIAGISSLLSGINFLVTIFKMRCPGMTMMKMPIFIWSVLGTLVLILFAFPILTATLGLLALDRYMGMHFFTPGFGGNQMMYVNLIWAWGHPEVYIIVLPAFGVFSEVVATFSQKRLFGYVSMVCAIAAITFLSFIVWLHHFFTMGAGPNVNAFFGLMTMLIAIPTGVKVFNWLFTQVSGRVHFATPMLWFLGFTVIFTIGGMTGVMMSVPPIDYQVHNSLFLVAHFHSVILGGTIFGFFAGLTYWFPKITGVKLDEKLGRRAFWCWFVGFVAAFMPLYLLGLMGATRRLNHYEASTGWRPFFLVASAGVALVLCGLGLQLRQLFLSVKMRHKNRDLTGDPWNGRTLEWATSSPPATYNFAIVPVVHTRDPFWVSKQAKQPDLERPQYEAIRMPKHSPIGFYVGLCSFLLGFALTWHIWWLAASSFLGAISCLIVRLSGRDAYHHYISAEEVEQTEAARMRKEQDVWQGA